MVLAFGRRDEETKKRWYATVKGNCCENPRYTSDTLCSPSMFPMSKWIPDSSRGIECVPKAARLFQSDKSIERS